ncbi:ABC transporter permease [Exiguobacterium flavidum]|uniref:ABC transporter permease n=1 Tax=Exiguobacterium flavidum TaxID=2184695 RepID=UPI000DF7B8E1|nr:ABC transporter permease [Exiguobacterium flavidum]
MLKFVLNNWRRQRYKFLLTLIGALVISAGLSLMFNLTDSSQGTVEATLQKKWSSAYDIVVRPKGSMAATESENLLEPNYLNGINGDISFNQYEHIKRMQDVEIAAPVAVLGYTQLGLDVPDKIHLPNDKGIYRVTQRQTDETGFGKEVISELSAYLVRGGVAEEPDVPAMFSADNGDNSYILPRMYSMIVAIDPEQEARLVGLDESVFKGKGKHRYFSREDRATYVDGDKNFTELPVLINPNSFNRGTLEFVVERLDVPFEVEEDQRAFYSKIPSGEKGREVLAATKSQELQHITIPSKDVEQTYFNLLSGNKTSAPLSKDLEGAKVLDFAQLAVQTDSLSYQEETSPYPKRWQKAYSIASNKVKVTNPWILDGMLPQNGYRTAHSLEKKTWDDLSEGWAYLSPSVRFNIIGLYDPDKIRVSKDPLNELPMETYRPSSAELVLDEAGQPVNPARPINTSGNPVGLLTNSPSILTTIDSAKMIYGDKSISSIRLKIKGSAKVSEESERILQQVKQTIERETGLVATITKGSSPQPVVTKVIEDGKALGWIEQPWIHIGAAITIFRETSVGFSSVIFAMLAVAVVYVLATSYVSMLARRKEFAVLLALGWRTQDLYRVVALEALLLAGFVSFVATLVEAVFSYIQQERMNLGSLVLIGAFSLAIYLTGAAWSAWTIRRISPYEAIKTGEYARASHLKLALRSTWTLALKEIFGKWKRNLLSVFSIALPTALLTFFLFVTYHLQGVLYTSWLGQFVALQVGPMHYVTMGVAIAIAILTTGEIMWQNVSDRRQSLAVLKAVGWSNRSVRHLIVLEGTVVGLVSGILGLSLTYLSIYFLYDLVPWDKPLLIGVSLLLPILFGIIASLLPAEIASRVNPYQELKEAG